jgi:N-acetylmuramoyl-L-alanine amidase
VVVLDPAHGGADEGATLGRAGSEKDLNQAFAARLKDLLTAQGFTVILTHASADDAPDADQRAELANRSRAVACLLLHETATGQGVHLFTSSLTPPSGVDDARADASIALWDSAQASALPRSLQLASDFSTSLNGLKIPLLVGSVSVSPIDSMVCPAVAVEIAPPTARGNVADDSYQQRIAESLVTALVYWRQHAREQIAAAAQAATGAGNGVNPATTLAKPKPKPKPAMITSPDEVPLVPDSTTPVPSKKPAPIERQPPADTPAPPNGVQP